MNVRICALLWCFLRCVNNSRMVLLAVEKPVRVYGIACIGVRERLYGCAEKPISACGKGYMRMWYGLFRSVEKAFSRVGNGRMRWRFFQYADIQRFMLSLQNHHIVCRFFWICWYEMFDFIASKFAYTVAGRVVLVCARFSASWRYTVFLTISTIWCGYVKTVNINRTLSFMCAAGQISPHDDNRSTREEKTSKRCIIKQSPLRY